MLISSAHSPGLRDANVARIAVTERQLKKCDDIFAVGSIGRAKTDAGIVSVFNLAAQVGLTNVGIVCTKSDVCPQNYAF
jgi:riboflavin synthase